MWLARRRLLLDRRPVVLGRLRGLALVAGVRVRAEVTVEVDVRDRVVDPAQLLRRDVARPATAIVIRAVPLARRDTQYVRSV